MNKIQLVDMKPGMVYDEPVYLDGRYIILTPDVPVSEDLLRELSRWNFPHVLTSGSTEGHETLHTGSLAGVNLDQDQKEREGLERARDFYEDFLDFTDTLLENFKKTNSLDLGRTTDYLKQAIELLKEDQYYILRFSEFQLQKDWDYQITHAVRSTIIALTIAINAKAKDRRIPPHKTIELGISCLLHEIGMLQIPPQLYNKRGELTPEEKKTITAHPILGYRLLKEMKGIAPFSQDILMGVLQHHERENGSGYPQRLTGDKISLYGKIISIACSYDAQISNRPHRTGKDGHSSMTSLLKEMQSHYDPSYVSSLMSCLSLFPLGSYVEMGDGSIATVVKSSEENIRQPFLKVLLDNKRIPITDTPVVQTETEGKLSIIRVLNDQEVLNLKKQSLI